MWSLPVACSLIDSEPQERRHNVLQRVISIVSEVKEIEHGFIYRFPSDGTWIRELANLIELEHQCLGYKHIAEYKPEDIGRYRRPDLKRPAADC